MGGFFIVLQGLTRWRNSVTMVKRRVGHIMKKTKIAPLALKDVVIGGAFWSRYSELIRTKMIPYQWDVLNDRVEDAPRSGCIKNFEIAAGRAQGEFYGMVFQDSDLYKWLECAAYSLETHPDAGLEALTDGAIELIEAAQDANGYVNTYYTVKAPEGRWKNLQHGHELYCAGHLIEAAVAYYNATGKRKALDVAVRFADHIDQVFGLEQGKIDGYCGHQEVELALCKLHEVTGERRYLMLAAYFINQRGQEPNYFELEQERPGYVEIFPGLTAADKTYNQSHKPPVEQEAATGHAVRAVYMYSAMADLAAELDDAALLAACDRLYDNVVNKQMYVTGAIGSSSWGERFTVDYDLPNNLYGETCASVGLMMFCRRMNALHGGGQYADVMELALYNTVLAGMSLAGTEFYYVNPLEVDPKTGPHHPSYRHAKPVRQKWFACACCPANLGRTITGLGLYAYAGSGEGLYVNLYIEGSAKQGGREIDVATMYPFEDSAVIKARGGAYKLHLRNPQDARIVSIAINGQDVPVAAENGYYVLERDWQDDEIAIKFDISVKAVYSAPEVQGNAGKVAIKRGPIVYCMEEVDNSPLLNSYVLGMGSNAPDSAQLADIPKGLLPETYALKLPVYKEEYAEGALYRTEKPSVKAYMLTMIPYFQWANRGANEMRVWVRR